MSLNSNPGLFSHQISACKDGPGLAIDVVKVSTNQRAGLRTTDQSQAWILTMKLPW